MAKNKEELKTEELVEAEVVEAPVVVDNAPEAPSVEVEWAGNHTL